MLLRFWLALLAVIILGTLSFHYFFPNCVMTGGRRGAICR